MISHPILWNCLIIRMFWLKKAKNTWILLATNYSNYLKKKWMISHQKTKSITHNPPHPANGQTLIFPSRSRILAWIRFSYAASETVHLGFQPFLTRVNKTLCYCHLSLLKDKFLIIKAVMVIIGGDNKVIIELFLVSIITCF